MYDHPHPPNLGSNPHLLLFYVQNHSVGREERSCYGGSLWLRCYHCGFQINKGLSKKWLYSSPKKPHSLRNAFIQSKNGHHHSVESNSTIKETTRFPWKCRMQLLLCHIKYTVSLSLESIPMFKHYHFYFSHFYPLMLYIVQSSRQHNICLVWKFEQNMKYSTNHNSINQS